MIRRLLAIGFIFACTSIAWMVLGGTMLSRTYMADRDLREAVEQIWGEPHLQRPPRATYTVTTRRTERTENDAGETETRVVEREETHKLPLLSSGLDVDLDLAHRQKGLLWYATYTVDFAGTYRFRNDSGEPRELTLAFPFPADSTVYDGFAFAVEEREWDRAPAPEAGAATGALAVDAGEVVVVNVAYRSQGVDTWRYRFGDAAGYNPSDRVTAVRDFRLTMDTDFERIDFPQGTISPTEKTRTDEGWRLTWSYRNLLTGAEVGMALPNRLQPGPVAARISLFAPVSLFFFIVMLLVVALLRDIAIHPMHFFFLAAAFFSFHLLLAYLVDHMAVHVAFAVAALVSLGLVVSYLRAAIGTGFALRWAAPIQFVYLVLFSYTFFFEGYTGLAVTIGAVVSLFVMMQLTARVDWEAVFAGRGPHRPPPTP